MKARSVARSPDSSRAHSGPWGYSEGRLSWDPWWPTLSTWRGLLQGSVQSFFLLTRQSITVMSPATLNVCTPATFDSPLGTIFSTSTRSEEHTSELQSLTNLVCRLLL